MHMIDRNSPCWCGSGLKYKKCHYDFDEKLKMYENKGCIVPEHNMIKTPEQIEKIKASARVNIAVLDYVAEHIKAGVTTEEIDQWVYDETTKRGAIPAPLNFEGFPKSVCTSINEVVCHGIPDPDRVLQDGDIIESRFAVERRNRTIHARMRGYLYTLTHMPEFQTSVVPIGDGVALSVKR